MKKKKRDRRKRGGDRAFCDVSLADLLNCHSLKAFKFEWKWNENKNKDDLSNTTNPATKLCKICKICKRSYSVLMHLKTVIWEWVTAGCWWALPTQSSSPPPPAAVAMPSCPSNLLALQWQPSSSDCTHPRSNVLDPTKGHPRNTAPYLCAPGLLLTAKGQSCCSSKRAADMEAVEGAAKAWRLVVLWEPCCSWNWGKGAEHPQSHSCTRRLCRIKARAPTFISPSPPGKFGPMLSLKPPDFLYTVF